MLSHIFWHPPTHPGQTPNDNEANFHVLTQWNKNAKKFTEFYLALFHPESNLYGEIQQNNYSYEQKDLVAFVSNLQQNNHIAIKSCPKPYIQIIFVGTAEAYCKRVFKI